MRRRTFTVYIALQQHLEPVKASVYEYARQAGWHVLDLTYFNMTIPKPSHADGIIFRNIEGEAPLSEQIRRWGAPTVEIKDTLLAGRMCSVAQDFREAGRSAAEHFAGRGHRNMAYLHAEAYDISPLRPLGESFISRARALGARADLISVQRRGDLLPWSRFDALAKRFEQEVSRLELPLAIFTYNDVMAIRICHFCRSIGLSVPDQVAVLGRGNDYYRCELAPVSLSSVDPNYGLLGKTAAERLDALMAGRPVPRKHTLIPPKGIETRQSTDVMAIPHAETARALQFIWDHLAEPLQVYDVAKAVGISRRKLERDFRTHLRRGVNEELTRKRIERSCELLVGGELTAREIARQVGFSTDNYFGRVFRAETGMTPSQYRDRHSPGHS